MGSGRFPTTCGMILLRNARATTLQASIPIGTTHLRYEPGKIVVASISGRHLIGPSGASGRVRSRCACFAVSVFPWGVRPFIHGRSGISRRNSAGVRIAAFSFADKKCTSRNSWGILPTLVCSVLELVQRCLRELPCGLSRMTEGVQMPLHLCALQ